MIISLKRVFVIILAAQSLRAMAAQTVYEEFGRNMDRQFVHMSISDSESDQVVGVSRHYLEGRKSQVDPERSKFITYQFFHLMRAKAESVEFLMSPGSQNIAVGSGTTTHDTYTVPFVTDNRKVDIYTYDLGANVAKKLQTDWKTPEARIDAVFALTSGYIRVEGGRNGAEAYYLSYDGQVKRTLHLVKDANVLLSIQDVTKISGKVYLVGTARGTERETYLWLASFENIQSGSPELLRLVDSSGTAKGGRFIPTTQSTASVQVSEGGSIFGRPIVRIVRLGKMPVTVWSKKLADVEQLRRIAVAEVCEGVYVSAAPGDIADGIGQTLRFRGIGTDVKALNVESRVSFENAVISDVELIPNRTELYAGINFSKLEGERRADGWYSWKGFGLYRLANNLHCE